MGRILREMEMRHKGEFFSTFQQVETKNKTKSMILHSLIMHKEHKEVMEFWGFILKGNFLVSKSDKKMEDIHESE